MELFYFFRDLLGNNTYSHLIVFYECYYCYYIYFLDFNLVTVGKGCTHHRTRIRTSGGYLLVNHMTHYSLIYL